MSDGGDCRAAPATPGLLISWIVEIYETRWCSPVDSRPSTAEAPPIGKIHPFSKMAATFEPLIGL